MGAQNTSSMHIGLSAQLLSLDHSYRGAGINSYIYHLLQHIGRAGSAHRYSAFLGDRRFADERLAVRYTRWPTSRPVARILWEQMALPVAIRRTRIDLLHAMAFVAPVVAKCPFVTTIYDLSFLRYPEAFRPLNRWYLKQFTSLSARRARRIIAISESTKRDVVDFLRVPPDRVGVVYCGADDVFRPLPADEVSRFRSHHGLPDRFVLFLGTLEPRKNVQTLMRAYARWRKTDPGAPKMVVAGGKGWYYQQIFAEVEALGVADDVMFPGYVPREDLALCYNAAGLFVYPSRFEGFGLPVLEAMACGIPVVCTDVSSLPEVAGNAALLVAPDDENQLAEAMQRAWNDDDLRQEMVDRGRFRAAEFTWERTARQTIEIYERALDGSG